jgi:hypothetical protein
MKKLLLAYVVVAFSLIINCGAVKGKQGDTIHIRGKYGFNIVVEYSNWTNQFEGHYLVSVQYRITNTGDRPTQSFWNNKVLIDSDNRQYAPHNGSESDTIQPGATSEILSVFFSVPNSIDVINDIYFGNENNNYKIKLFPRLAND